MSMEQSSIISTNGGNNNGYDDTDNTTNVLISSMETLLQIETIQEKEDLPLVNGIIDSITPSTDSSIVPLSNIISDNTIIDTTNPQYTDDLSSTQHGPNCGIIDDKILTYIPLKDELVEKIGQESIPPITAFLRSLAVANTTYWESFDQWLTDTGSSSKLLSDYAFILSVCDIDSKPRSNNNVEEDDDVTKSSTEMEDKSNPNFLLGKSGRDLEETLLSQRVNLSENDDIFNAKQVINSFKLNDTKRLLNISEQGDIKFENTKIEENKEKWDFNEGDLMCYIHERVAREIKKSRLSYSWVYDVIGKQIVEGAIIRHEHQYSKKVDRDVREARLDCKARILYARQGNAILIMDLIWDHKLNDHIKTAQRELDSMRLWMLANKEQNDDPFVIVDTVSGRLKPLYKIDLTFDKKNMEIQFKEEKLLYFSSEYDTSVFDLVLSPDQKSIQEDVMASISINKGGGYFSANDESLQDSTYISKKGLRPDIKMIFIQGSAGNGKTTCLLSSGFQRSKRSANNETVVLVCATSHLADSTKKELKESSLEVLSSALIVTQDHAKKTIREWLFKQDPLKYNPDNEISRMECLEWIRSLHAFDATKLKEGEEYALAEWLVRGAKESSNSEAYKSKSDQYLKWKRSIKKYDEGDLWLDVLESLRRHVPSGWDGVRKNPMGEDDGCDVLIVDEAQLYPADSFFEILLLWYRPTRFILVGMDTKQAIELGCSKRVELLEAAKRACHVVGWRSVNDDRHNLTMNFRLPVKCIALSNSMVAVMKSQFPKMFDEYSLDEKFEKRMLAQTSDPETNQICLDTETDVIGNFVCVLISGAAGRKIKELIKEKIQNKTDSVLDYALRLANTENPTDMLGGKDGLKTIHFSKCSGIESPYPILVDCMISCYIEKMCPRSIFSKAFGDAQGRKWGDLTPAESSLLSTALCRIYTILTRCRGPLIWVEDFAAEKHPLIMQLKKRLEVYKVHMEFISDIEKYDASGKCIFKVDELYLHKIFSPPDQDPDEINANWEESIRGYLNLFRRELHNCMSEYNDFLYRHPETAANGTAPSLPIHVLNSLKENADCVCKALRVQKTPEITELVEAIQSIPILFDMHRGDWAVQWNEQLHKLVKLAHMFPELTVKICRITLSLIPELKTNILKDQLIHRCLKICTCNSYQRTHEDIEHILAFIGPRLITASTTINNSSTSTVLTENSSGTKKKSFNGGMVWIISRVNLTNDFRNDCVTQDSYTLTSYSPGGLLDSVLLYKFSQLTNLTIFKGANNWLEFSEITNYSKRMMIYHSSNEGMKCHCDEYSTSCDGLSYDQSYGQFIGCDKVALTKHFFSTYIKFGKRDIVMNSTLKNVLITPLMNDATMIAFLSNYFKNNKDPGFSPLAVNAERSARLIWNNLFAGHFSTVEKKAKYQPWRMLFDDEEKYEITAELLARSVEQHIGANCPGALVSKRS